MEYNRHPEVSSDNEKLTKFRMKVQGLKEQEAEEGKKVHFKNINPEDLTEADLALYEKLQSGELTVAELQEHERTLIKSGARIGDSRTSFSAFLRNKLSAEPSQRE